jgi:uncharacterized protein YcgI (DUF1989 family)
MPSVVQEVIVPAAEGRSLEVKKGQVLRIYIIEAPQLGDAAFFNLHNLKEQFHVGQTWAINHFLGTGNARSFRDFYSNPPYENVMLTVVEDTTKNHFGNMSGRCSPRMNELRGLMRPSSCQQNVAKAVAPYGLKDEDIHDMFNLFMNVDLNSDGSFVIKPSIAKEGDYIDLRAEMDILVGLSACPGGEVPHPLGMRVYEP